jgi:hypothetical protein
MVPLIRSRYKGLLGISHLPWLWCEPKRTGILETIGLDDDGTLHNGVLINHLEDWRYAYDSLITTVHPE